MNQEQMAGLRKSYETFGYLDPIIIDQDFLIADGEHRVLVYKEFGKKTISAFQLELTDIQRRLLRQTLNKLRGSHDKRLDADELALIYEKGKLSDLSTLIATSDQKLKEHLIKYRPDLPFGHEQDAGIDKIIDEQMKRNAPDTKLGDVIELGRHRLICADCTDKRALSKLLQNKVPDMVFTDPPYNIGFNYNEYDDKKSVQEYTEFMKTWYDLIVEIGVPRIVVTPGPRNIGVWYNAAGPPKDIGTWHKLNGETGATIFYLRKCEPILFYGEYENDQKRTSDYFDHNMYFDNKTNYAVHSAKAYTDGNKEVHAPGKPLRLISDIIESYTKIYESVIDLFMGSGTTLIACEMANRICYGVELDPRYCDVVIKRWEAFTRMKAKRL